MITNTRPDESASCRHALLSHTQCIDEMVSLKSIHPQNRQLILDYSLLRSQVDEFMGELTLDKSFNLFIVRDESI